MPDVVISNLTKSYGDRTVVDNISLAIRSNDFVTLLGPSGCGKTTTLRMLAGLEQPDRGSVTVAGRPIFDSTRGVFTPAEKRDVGMVFQNYALWPHMTVHGNVAYPLRRKGVRGKELQSRVAEALKLVGLEDYPARSPDALSGGQQQRVALGRAIVGKPGLLLFDEPLSNLDAKLRARMRVELRRMHREIGTTSIFVTHDQVEAITLSDSVVVMNAGSIEQVGTPDQVYNRPATRFVADFMGFENILPGTVAGTSPPRTDVRLSDGTVIVVDAQVGVTIGESVEVAIRSRNLHLGEISTNAPTIAATVQSVTYVGDYYEVILTSGAGPLTARVEAEPRGALGIAGHEADHPAMSVSILAETAILLRKAE